MLESPSIRNIPQHAEITGALNKVLNDINGIISFLTSYDQVVGIQPIKPSVLEIEHKKHLQSSRTSAEILESVKAARVAIGAANKPLPLGILYQDIRAKGFQIMTENPRGTYGARLRDRSKQFNLIFLKGFGWWLSERPYEPANYTPGTLTKRRLCVGQGVKKRLLPQVVQGKRDKPD